MSDKYGNVLLKFTARLHGKNHADGSQLNQFTSNGVTPTGLFEFDLNSPEPDPVPYGPYPVNRDSRPGNAALVITNDNTTTLRRGILMHTGQWAGWQPPMPMPNSDGCNSRLAASHQGRVAAARQAGRAGAGATESVRTTAVSVSSARLAVRRTSVLSLTMSCVHSFEVDPSTHELQCVLCGFVEPRVVLDEQASGEHSGQFIHALAAVQSGAQLDASLSARRLNELGARSVGSDRLRKRVEAVVLRCAPQLQLCAHQTQQTTAMMHDLIQRKLWRGRYAERVVAACAYTVLRRDGEPRTLRDVASTLRLEERDVVRAYQRIVGLLGFKMPLVDATAFAERAVANLDRIAKLDLKLPEQRALVDVTTRILTLCQTTALWGTGRRPEALVAAALSVAVDALKLTERIQLEHVRSACDTAPSTLKERRSELHKQVLAWADAYSTWLQRPVRHYSAVVPSLLTLIKQTEMLTQLSTQDDTAGITKLFDDDDDEDNDNDDDDDDGCADNADGNAAVADPPAYVNAVQKSDRRMALIVGTKLRMIESGNQLDFTDMEAPYLADGAKAHLVDVHAPLSAQDERDANTIRLLVLSGVGVRDMLTVNDLTRLLPARQTASEQGIDLDSTQITGADMDDAELSTYVLSDAERQVKRARVAADASMDTEEKKQKKTKGKERKKTK